MSYALLTLALVVLPACSNRESTHLYIACHCPPGAVDCQDSVSPVATISTEKCAKGARLEVICTGGGCPSTASPPAAPARDGGG